MGRKLLSYCTEFCYIKLLFKVIYKDGKYKKRDGMDNYNQAA